VHVVLLLFLVYLCSCGGNPLRQDQQLSEKEVNNIRLSLMKLAQEEGSMYYSSADQKTEGGDSARNFNHIKLLLMVESMIGEDLLDKNALARQERITELSFRMQDHLALTLGKTSIKPYFSQFESLSDPSGNIRIVFGFKLSDQQLNEGGFSPLNEYNVVFEDPFWQTGTHQFSISAN
jgi:hypothetical protein